MIWPPVFTAAWHLSTFCGSVPLSNMQNLVWIEAQHAFGVVLKCSTCSTRTSSCSEASANYQPNRLIFHSNLIFIKLKLLLNQQSHLKTTLPPLSAWRRSITPHTDRNHSEIKLVHVHFDWKLVASCTGVVTTTRKLHYHRQQPHQHQDGHVYASEKWLRWVFAANCGKATQP